MTILFVLTSHNEFVGLSRPTGTWLEELLQPYYHFIEEGYEVAFASPKGGSAPIDPSSVSALEGQPLLSRYLSDTVLRLALENCLTLRSVALNDFEAAIYPGGHGPLWDLKDDPSSIKLVETFLNGGKPLGVICHAGCVLISAKRPDGKSLVRERSLTAFSDNEERAVGLGDSVPYIVQAELIRLGARYSNKPNWEAHVVVDNNLITGQNPASALGVAAAMVSALRNHA